MDATVGTTGEHRADNGQLARLWRPDWTSGVEITEAVDWKDPCVVYHERYTVCTMIRSDLEWRYRGRTYDGGPGRLMVMEPGELHVTTTVAGPGTFAVVSVDDDVISPIAAGMGLRSLPHLEPERALDPTLWKQFLRLHHVARDERYNALYRQSVLTDCLRRLIERCIEGSVPRSRSYGRRAVERARDHIHDSVGGHVGLDELASIAGVSACHLSREFTRVVGLPQHRYQMVVMVEHARARLRAGDGAKTVAADVGFSDQSHMNRWFLRVLGMTPGAYAKSG